MKIIYDIVHNGDGVILAAQFVDLSPALAAEIVSPIDGKTMLNPLGVMALLQADKSKLAVAGFLVPTQIPGHPVGTTRWDIIVAEANKPTAIPEVKALTLT